MSELRVRQIDYVSSGTGYEVSEGQPTELHGLYAPTVDYEELIARISEGNETYDVISGRDGRPYESDVFNQDKLPVARILKPSTSFSSLLKNPGNALESALAATVNPGSAYIYLGSFGNHPTGHLSASDLWQVARSGRYTTGSGSDENPYSPLDGVQDLAETLQTHNLAPTHLSADVEAGRLALGLMAALKPNSIKGAYLNGLDGISPSASYVRAKLSEDWKSRIQRRGIKEGQPGELTPINIKDVKSRMPNIYHGLGRIAHVAPLPVLLFPRDDLDKLAVTAGFRGHNNLDRLDDHAVFNDMRAALLRQDATITLQFNTESAIHSVDDCIKFGKMIMESLPAEVRTDNRRVRLLIGQGTLDQYTVTPHDRTRVERYAFPDIAQKMTAMAGMAGNLLVESQVFQLPSAVTA